MRNLSRILHISLDGFRVWDANRACTLRSAGKRQAAAFLCAAAPGGRIDVLHRKVSTCLSTNDHHAGQIQRERG